MILLLLLLLLQLLLRLLLLLRRLLLLLLLLLSLLRLGGEAARYGATGAERARAVVCPSPARPSSAWSAATATRP